MAGPLTGLACKATIDEGDANPRDVPYVELQRKTEADGVLSRDKHIEAMGEMALKLDFVLIVRRYSRAASVNLNIYVSGILQVAWDLQRSRGGIQAIGRVFSRLPPWVKYLALAAPVAVDLHPASRRRLLSCLDGLAEIGEKAVPRPLALVDSANQNQSEAAETLDATRHMLRKGKWSDGRQ